MALLFATALFLSAALLFWVQPMVAKILLPLLGGSPSVWNTCMVFFQAGLLGGYVYAHWVSTRLALRTQVLLHLVLLGVAGLLLPIHLSQSRLAMLPEVQSPAEWLLLSLGLMVGLPFFLLSSTAPLLQRWYSRTGQVGARDPYFLYSASNVGSLLALLAYPLLLEPGLGLSGQALAWTAVYVVVGMLIAGCGWWLCRVQDRGVDLDLSQKEATAREVLNRLYQNVAATFKAGDLMARNLNVVAQALSALDSQSSADRSEEMSELDATMDAAPLTVRRRLFWIFLAWVPSSLMLGVTTFLTTDIASLPLLWVIPLGLYLMTFALVFARRPWLPLPVMARVLPFAAMGLLFLMISRTTEPAWLVLVPHLIFFFVAAMVCHGRLAADRPATRHLTEFYLCLSVGGVAGGVFNALVAPHLFRSVLEYPLVVALACLLIPPRQSAADDANETTRSALFMDAALPVLLGLGTFCLAWGTPWIGLESNQTGRFLVAGVPAIFVFLLSSRPWRFGLGVAAVLIGGWQFLAPAGQTICAERNFFGVSHVQRDADENLHRLIHGNTFHGRQFTDPARRCEPLAYYHREGPFGEIAEVYHQHPAAPRVAVIGLGAGTMAAYAQPGQHWIFYEIDPAVIRMAQDTNLFTYLQGCCQGTWDIVAGDARLQLQQAPDRHFGLIILDAFSSDAIPVHLLTREALSLYASKLAPGGMLAFHISNRYLDLKPVIGALARDGDWLACSWHDRHLSPEQRRSGRDPSHWAVMAKEVEDLGLLARRVNWELVTVPEGIPVWTDDYSNIISVFNWR